MTQNSQVRIEYDDYMDPDSIPHTYPSSTDRYVDGRERCRQNSVLLLTVCCFLLIITVIMSSRFTPTVDHQDYDCTVTYESKEVPCTIREAIYCYQNKCNSYQYPQNSVCEYLNVTIQWAHCNQNQFYVLPKEVDIDRFVAKKSESYHCQTEKDICVDSFD